MKVQNESEVTQSCLTLRTAKKYQNQNSSLELSGSKLLFLQFGSTETGQQANANPNIQRDSDELDSSVGCHLYLGVKHSRKL